MLESSKVDPSQPRGAVVLAAPDPEQAPSQQARRRLVEYAAAAVHAQAVDQAALQSGDGHGAVGGAGELQARVLLVEILVEADAAPGGAVDGDIGEVGVAQEGGEAATPRARLVSSF